MDGASIGEADGGRLDAAQRLAFVRHLHSSCPNRALNGARDVDIICRNSPFDMS